MHNCCLGLQAAASALPSAGVQRLPYDHNWLQGTSREQDCAVADCEQLVLQPMFSAVQLDERPKLHTDPGSGGGGRKRPDKDPDFYANVGSAIRTLREDIPLLFQKDLDCKAQVSWSCCLRTKPFACTCSLHQTQVMCKPGRSASAACCRCSCQILPCDCMGLRCLCLRWELLVLQMRSTGQTSCSETPKTPSRASKTTRPSSGPCAFTARSSSRSCAARSSACGRWRTPSSGELDWPWPSGPGSGAMLGAWAPQAACFRQLGDGT